jgi:pyruvate ferredoxin oxidoreductase alpha subunit
MGERRFLNGNQAMAHAVRMARPEVMAVYPITPQTAIIEKLAEFVADGQLDADFIRVESEHSALAACFGASCAGCRVFTATCSQGLVYMCEMLHYVSSTRFPVVMAVVNRSLAAPWTMWCDHQDSVSMRDCGWIQLYVENAQEAFDTCLQAYRLAEDPEVLTPVMICLDGFTLSHTDESVDLPSQEEVAKFLPSYSPQHAIDVHDPATFAIGTPPDFYMEYKYSQQLAMEAALGKIPQISGEFERRFHRNHGCVIKEYHCEDAEYILVTMGSVTGTARSVVENLRSKGKRVGVLKIRSFRPFPKREIVSALKNAKGIGVLDRDCSFGNEGALGTEVKSALFEGRGGQQVINFVAGLGGRDIPPGDIEGMFAALEEAVAQPCSKSPVNFIGLRYQ